MEKEENTACQEVNVTQGPGLKKQPSPDGGWGWLMVLGFCFSHFVIGFSIKAFGVTYLILLDKFQASATATIWIGAMTMTFTFSTGALSSALCRRFGCRSVSMAGAAMVVTGFIATGQAPNIYVIYVTFGLMVGLGLGFIYTPGYIIISQYFDKRKALALSLTAVVNGGSALVCPPLLLFLNRDYAFSGMFLILGGICLHLFVGAALYRPLNPRVKTSEGNKSPDDIKENTMRERYSALISNYTFIAFAVLSMSINAEVGIIATLLPAIAVDNGIDKTKAAFLLSISAISAVTGSLALGHLFDVVAIRRFRKHIYAGWCVVLGVGVLLIGVVSTYPAYVTLGVLAGVSNGLLLPQTITIIGDIVSKTSDMEGFGVSNFLNGFGILIVQAIAGPIKDYSGRYNMAYLLAGGFVLAAALVFEAAVIRHERAQRTQLTHTQTVVVAD